MKRGSRVFGVYTLWIVMLVAALNACSLKERQSDEAAVRADLKNLHYVRPKEEKELPIYDPKLAFFEFNKALLTAQARDALVPTAKYLNSHPELRVVIEGYCDERGSDAYNLKLGEKRALAAKQYLAALGVTESRMRTISYGRIVDNSKKNWAKNRRIGFQIFVPVTEQNSVNSDT